MKLLMLIQRPQILEKCHGGDVLVAGISEGRSSDSVDLFIGHNEQDEIRVFIEPLEPYGVTSDTRFWHRHILGAPEPPPDEYKQDYRLDDDSR